MTAGTRAHDADLPRLNDWSAGSTPFAVRVGGRDGDRPGTGGARGNARAAARRAPKGAKAELPVRSQSASRGRLRPPAEGVGHFALPDALPRAEPRVRRRGARP